MKTYLGLLLVLVLAGCGTPLKKQTLEPEANYWKFLTALSGEATGGDITIDHQGRIITAVNNALGVLAVRYWNGSQWISMGTMTDNFSGNVILTSGGEFSFLGYPKNFGTVASPAIKTVIKLWDGTSWNTLGSFTSVSSMAADETGALHIAYMNNGDLFASKWTGSWTSYGTTPLDKLTTSTPRSASIGLDISNRPVVAWEEDDNIFVKLWNGASWQFYSTTPLDTIISQGARNPSLVMNGNNPVVSWQEFTTPSNLNIYIKQWNASLSLWESIGSSALDITLSNSAFSPVTSFNGAGNPVVTWLESTSTGIRTYMKEWTGTTWTFVGANPIDTNSPVGVLNTALLNGQLAVIWGDNDPREPGKFYVKHYITNAWQNLGGLVDVSGGQSATNASIVRTSSNIPIVAWDELAGSNRNVYVKQRSGNTWTLLGNAALDNTLSHNAENPSLAIRSDSRPVVAWQENGSIFVSQYNGTSWLDLGSSLNVAPSSFSASNPSIALQKLPANLNNPVVAWQENGKIYVKRWDSAGSTWIPYGTAALNVVASNDAFSPSLALDSADNPYVAWSEFDGSSFNIYLKRWSVFSSTWISLGSALDKTPSLDAEAPSLALNSLGLPFVAWQEAGNIYVKRWNDSNWMPVGSTLDKVASNEALRPSLKLRSDNQPVVTWQEWSGSSYDIWVKRWNGSSWNQIGIGAIDRNLSRSAERPSLVLKTDNNPMVAWDEDDGISENIYARQF